MNVTVKKVNAFTDSIIGGNPAGVVLSSPNLTSEQMKHISKEMLVSETAFVYPSAKADIKTRFFSPTIEVDLCGHATIATFFTMALLEMFPRSNRVVTQETKIGILPVSLFYSDENVIDKVMMTQKRPIYKNIHLDISMLSDALNVERKNIDTSLPKQIVSTGLFTLPVCIKSLDVLKILNPDFKKIKTVCEKIGAGSIHVFSFETIKPDSVYHARNFAPVYGINEDPVTGTANGAVSSYLIHHNIIKKTTLICEQGDFIGRPGRVYVEIDDAVRVGGKAAFAEERTLAV